MALAAPDTLMAQAGRRGGVLDVNTASDKELVSVPGVTAAVARASWTGGHS